MREKGGREEEGRVGKKESLDDLVDHEREEFF